MTTNAVFLIRAALDGFENYFDPLMARFILSGQDGRTSTLPSLARNTPYAIIITLAYRRKLTKVPPGEQMPLIGGIDSPANSERLDVSFSSFPSTNIVVGL